jgi:hypothetical protein
MGTAGGHDKFYVPRLTGGFGANINVDKTNKKVRGQNTHACRQRHRFSGKSVQAAQQHQPLVPAFSCDFTSLLHYHY